jgi:hypothetical protein
MSIQSHEPYKIVTASQLMSDAEIKTWLDRLRGFLNEYEEDGERIRDAIDANPGNQVSIAKGIKAAKDAGEIKLILRALIDLRSDILDSLCVTALKATGKPAVPHIVTAIEDISRGREPSYVAHSAEHSKNVKILYDLLAGITGKKYILHKLSKYRRWWINNR